MATAAKQFRAPGKRDGSALVTQEYRRQCRHLYDSAAWRNARDSFINDNPWCAECERNGLLRGATDVDHIKPHKLDLTLFWDTTNWQSLCHICHNRKSAKE